MDAEHSIAALLLAAGCSGDGDPRPQLLVVIDSDAPVAGQLATRPELSADAAIDTVRIDVLGDAGAIVDLREIVAPEPLDWPIGFGLATPLEGAVEPVRIRIRAFRGARAAPDPVLGALEPPREASIDRLIELAPPEEGVATVRVLLALACFGASPSFLEPATSCIDGADGAPGEGIEPLELVPSETRVGSAPLALEQPCAGVPPVPGAICIAGGFTLLGDAGLEGLEDLQVLDPLPLRPARLSPFWIDASEMTVGRFRTLLARGPFAAPLPRVRNDADPLAENCTFLGAGNAQNDALPLTCMVSATAEAACALDGGQLASEAEWEHAARGRGQGRRYPWGNDVAACCTASAGRLDGPCGSGGIEPVGSHPPSLECANVGDESRDGVRDLGGSVVEYARDIFAPYSDPCWSYAGIALDPVCNARGTQHASRGGSWDQSPSLTVSALRHAGVEGPSTGLRCVYEDTP